MGRWHSHKYSRGWRRGCLAIACLFVFTPPQSLFAEPVTAEPVAGETIVAGSGGGEPEAAAPDCTEEQGCLQEEAVPRRSVIDRSHDYATYGFDSVARWFDNFFGDVEEERESAHSIVRIHYDNIYSEGGEREDRVRARGKVKLPNLSRRVNLIFSDEEDDIAQPRTDERNLFNSEESESIALQLDVRDESDFKLDHRIGIKSGDELRIGSRARYRKVLAEFWKGSISEEIYWQDTIGFGSRTILTLDYVHDPKRLTRWRNRMRFTEKSDGVEWNSTIAHSRAIDRKRAVSYYIRAYGFTRPYYLTQGYGPGIVYRQNFKKKWLFFEVEPSYTWARDERDDTRDGVAAIVLRLEIAFSEEHRD